MSRCSDCCCRCLKYSHRALKNGFLLEAHRQGKQLLIRVIEDNPKAAPAEGLTVKVLAGSFHFLDVSAARAHKLVTVLTRGMNDRHS